MPYIHPEDVISPVHRWQHQDPPEILYDGGENSWSVAEGTYDEVPRIGIRWNGNLASGNGRRGFPVNRQPTWFIVPAELEDAVRQALVEMMEVP